MYGKSARNRARRVKIGAVRGAAGAGSLPSVLRPDPVGGDGRFAITTGALTQTLHQLTGWAIENGVELEERCVDLRVGNVRLHQVDDGHHQDDEEHLGEAKLDEGHDGHWDSRHEEAGDCTT